MRVLGFVCIHQFLRLLMRCWIEYAMALIQLLCRHSSCHINEKCIVVEHWLSISQGEGSIQLTTKLTVFFIGHTWQILGWHIKPSLILSCIINRPEHQMPSVHKREKRLNDSSQCRIIKTLKCVFRVISLIRYLDKEEW